MKTILLSSILSLLCLFSSCGRSVGDSSLYYSSGRAKPIVAVLPVIDSTQAGSMDWDLSEELTTEIQKKIYQSSKLYLLRQEITESLAHSLNKMDVKQISSDAIDALGAAEFAIVTELLDQKESAYDENVGSSNVGGLFSIALRVRILDLRGSVPKVILQEVIDHDHIIPRYYIGCDYKKIPWGSSGFELTPMGRAHNRIVRELIAHAEGYIGVSKG